MMEIRNITIVGAGTMGHSLAQVFAQEGYSVWLSDIDAEVLTRARKLIAVNLHPWESSGSKLAADITNIETVPLRDHEGTRCELDHAQRVPRGDRRAVKEGFHGDHRRDVYPKQRK